MRTPTSTLALTVFLLSFTARADAPFATGGLPIPVDGVRPASLPGALVSLRAPLAIHTARVLPPEQLTRVLTLAERILDAFERTLHLPLPIPDGARGGTPALDLYLVPSPSSPAASTTLDALDDTWLWDRASAFVTVRDDLAMDEARLARPLAEALAQAVLYGIDAHQPPSIRSAFAALFAARALGLPLDPDAVREFQRDPGEALLARRDPLASRGASLFLQHLAIRYDRPDLSLLRGLAAMPAARTDVSRWKLQNWPDLYDLLGRLVRDEPGGRDGMFLEFAVARLLAGTIGDREGLLGWQDDDTLHVHLSRTVQLRELPEWIVPDVPLEGTGTQYVLVDFSTPSALPTSHRLDVWFHGSRARRWAVTAVRLDARGHDVGHAPPVPVINGEWSTALELGPDVVRAAVVVCDLGNGDLDPTAPPDRNGLFALNLGGR